MQMDRRLFLISAAVAPLYAGPLVVFSDPEAKVIAGIIDHIIPADDTPGALAAGVVFYIDKQLAGPLKRFREAYKMGIGQFYAGCRERMGKYFDELHPAKQIEYLLQVENTSFFAMVVDHTMQGFYGSPEHGGNKGEASWKMLGIEDVMRGHTH